MLDWTGHLKHLQSILLEYNSFGTLGKLMMLRYFCKSLKPFIWVELEQRNLELENFEQLVKKVVKVESKTTLWPRSNLREIDQHYPRGSWLAYTTATKSNTQGQLIKNPQVGEPKTQSVETSSPQHSINSKYSKQAWKDKKKDQRNQHWKQQ